MIRMAAAMGADGAATGRGRDHPPHPVRASPSPARACSPLWGGAQPVRARVHRFLRACHLRHALCGRIPRPVLNPRHDPARCARVCSCQAVQAGGRRRRRFEGGAGGRGRARRRTCASRSARSACSMRRSRCATTPAPDRARVHYTSRRISLVALPTSGRRSTHSSCARTFAYPPTADGMSLLDPLAGRNASESAPLRHCGALGDDRARAPLRRPHASGVEEGPRGGRLALPQVGAALLQGGPSAPSGPGTRGDVREGRRGRPVGGGGPVVHPRSRDARRGRAGGGAAAAARAAARRHAAVRAAAARAQHARSSRASPRAARGPLAPLARRPGCAVPVMCAPPVRLCWPTSSVGRSIAGCLCVC